MKHNSGRTNIEIRQYLWGVWPLLKINAFIDASFSSYKKPTYTGLDGCPHIDGSTHTVNNK